MKLLNELQIISKKINDVNQNEFDIDFGNIDDSDDIFDSLPDSLFSDTEDDDFDMDADSSAEFDNNDELDFVNDEFSQEIEDDSDDEFNFGDEEEEDELAFLDSDDSDDVTIGDDESGMDEFDFHDENSSEDQESLEQPEDNDFQGNIRTIKGANLVYKRATEDGTFEELWVYNIGNDIKKETQIRRAILSGTDIDPSTRHSDDELQTADVESVGNVQFLHIQGLPN